MAAPRPMNKMRQFLAILRKNFILQTRGRRTLLGIGGLAGLILQVLLPVSFFLVMYLPKYYIKPFPHAESLGTPSVRLESRSWAKPYDGPATFHSHGGRASLILTPDVPEVRGLAVVLSRTLACPRDPRFRICPSANMPASFHCMFMPSYGKYGTNNLNGSSTKAYGTAAADGDGIEEGEVGGAEERLVGKGEGGDGVVVGDGGGGGGDGSDGGGGLPQGWRYRRRQRRRLRQQLLQELEDDVGGSSGGSGGSRRAALADNDVEGQGDDSVLATGDTCTVFSTCVVTPACYEHVLRNQITFMPSQEAARQATVSADQKWDAIVYFPRAVLSSSSSSPSSLSSTAATAAAAAADPSTTAAKAAKEFTSGISGGNVFRAKNGNVGYDDGLGSRILPSPVNLDSQFSVSELLSSVVIGMNHSDVPPTRLLLDLFEVVPTTSNGLALYKRYWFFTNLQLAIQKAVIGIHVAANTYTPPQLPSPPPSPPLRYRSEVTDQAAAAAAASQRKSLLLNSSSWNSTGHPYDNAVPADVEVSYKAFPWPAVTEDLGAAIAAVFFQLLLVFAFLPPTCAVVGDIVREKELRLREGMRVLGLSEPSYWLSWGLTHWLLLALSGALCTAAGTYPFSNSSAGVMLSYFWLYGAALVSYGYCLSTLFSSSRVAGTVVVLLYALSMLPGFLLPAVYPYGSWTWYVACLAPPSAATLYANVLINWELVAKGIRLSTLWTPITQANGFCAATVLWMLALDVVVYGLLAWYLDNVLPKLYGQRLPWWFVFDRRYWPTNSTGRADGSSPTGSGSTSGGGGGWRRLWRQLLDTKAVGWVRCSGGGDGDGNASLTSPLLASRRGGVNDDDCRTAVLPVSERDGQLHRGEQEGTTAGPRPAVEVRGLVKVFQTLTGESKVAVDHLDLQIACGRITALLGHNGAGKTTTIHILTGMLQPTAGNATVNGFDVATQMDLVRSSLGICPQFDILWPDLTVYEHLELYGAIKGYLREEIHELAVSAAEKVDLTSKLHCLAGELSGGQRRKLSVAIAFLGNPAVVFLDEPTSGMDPYSRRFTWEIIRQHRFESAIVLTTHSMEEADLLGDRVVILARGRVAAQGTGMELKAKYGVGYNLTLVMAARQQQQQQQLPRGFASAPTGALADANSAQNGATSIAVATAATTAAAAAAAVAVGAPSSPEAAVIAVVRRHVPAADLLSAAGAEIVVRLPREAASSFPALLRELDGPVGRQQLGVASYGLSLTTLEEVFLSITAAAEQQQEQQEEQQQQQQQEPPPPPVHPAPLYGWRLYGQQLRALFTKRVLCARRDRLAVLTQLAVPLALVYLALWIISFQVREPSEPPLELSRRRALFGRPLAWSALPAARNASGGCSSGGGGRSGSSCLAVLLAGHPAGARAIDSGATALYNPSDPRARPTTLEDYLLRRWYGGDGPLYDALHITSLPPPATLAAALLPSPLPSPPPPPLSFVLLTNQSAISALPAAIADAMTATLMYINGGLQPPAVAALTAVAEPPPPPSFSAASWPLPILATELVAQIKRDAASLMLVLCLVLASSVLSASFVVFIVREQDKKSKHLQLVSGAPATAYWAANYCWDLISYSLSAAGLLALIASYRLPQYSGQRLAAVAGLLWGFGPAGISLTYLLHFLFRDEMRALQRLNTVYFLTGYLGFIATWIADLIEMVVPRSGSLASWNRAAKWALRTASPHYCFSRGMYDIQSTYDAGFPFGKRGKPFDWDIFGSPVAHMAIQTLLYGSIVLLYDAGVLTVAYAYGQDAARWLWAFGRQRRDGGLPRGSGDGGGGGGFGGRDAAQLVALEEGLALTAETATAEAEARGTQSKGRFYRGCDYISYDDNLIDDEDVAAEKQAVVEGRRNNCQVLLAGVRKSYSQGWSRPAVAAVRGLWVGVPAGECFGLLGVNGAGKTTTFRMLTGEVMPDAGDARVAGFSVRKQLAAARRQLGYCPQFEALPGAMTGREVAAMYARLRGVPEPYVAGLVSYLLKRLGLEGAADSPSGGYSGGMKRKLGVAVALVGDPRVCALDEPSTGMDPGARRGLWTCLQNEVIRAGRTVVLTSHSMEECEALCTSLTILVAGRLRCLGTVQHLKSRFGGGYILEIKTLPRSASNPSLEGGPSPSPAPPPQSSHSASPGGGVASTAAALSSSSSAAAVNDAAAKAAALTEWVASVCPGAVLSYVDQNCFTFSLPREAATADNDDNPDANAGGSPRQQQQQQQQRHLDLAALFEAVESQRTALGVADYCLTQATLEQLFVSMAAANCTTSTTTTITT